MARRAPSSRAMRSHTTISISSSDGAFVGGLGQLEQEEVSDRSRSLSSMLPARATAAATIVSSDWSSDSGVTRRRLDRQHPDRAAGDQRLEAHGAHPEVGGQLGRDALVVLGVVDRRRAGPGPGP